MTRIKLEASKLLCTSCGLCWNEFPAFFGYDNNMLVMTKQEYVPDSFHKELLNIAHICPGESINISENS